MAGNEVRVDIVGRESVSGEIAKVIAALQALKDKTVEVKIDVDKDHLQDQINDGIKGVKTKLKLDVDRKHLKGEVNDAVDGLNNSKGRRSLDLQVNRKKFNESVRDSIRNLPDTHRSIDIDANIAQAIGKIDRLNNQIASLNGKELDIDANIGRAVGKINTLEAEITALNGKELDIDANIGRAVGKINALEGEIAALNGKEIDIDANTGRAIGKIAALEQQIDGLDGKTVNIDVDTAQAMGEVAALDSLIDTLDNKTVNVDLDSGAAMARLAAMEAAMAAMDGRVITIRMRTTRVGAADLPMPGDDHLITRWVNNFTRGVGRISGGLGRLTNRLPVIGAMFNGLAQVPALAGKITSAFVKMGGAVSKVGEMIGSAGMQQIGGLIGSLGKVAGPIGAAVAGVAVLSVALGALGTIGVVGATAVVGGVYATVAALGALVGISSVVGAAVGAGLIAPFVYFANEIPEVNEAFSSLGENLKNEMISISKVTAPALKKVATELQKGFGHMRPYIEQMASGAAGALDSLANRIPPVADALGPALSKMFQGGTKQLDLFAGKLPSVVTALGDLFGGLGSGEMLNAADKFWDSLPGVINKTSGALQGAAQAFNQTMGFLEAPNLQPFRDGFSGLFDDFANTDWSSATEGIRNVMNSLGEFVGGIDGKDVSNMIGSIMDGLANLTDLASSTDLVGLLGDLAGAFELFTGALSFGFDEMGLGNIVQSLGAILDMWGKIPEAAKRAFNIGGARDIASDMDAAKSSVESLRDSMNDSDIGKAWANNLQQIYKGIDKIGGASPEVADNFRKMTEPLEGAKKRLSEQDFSQLLKNTEATVNLVPDVSDEGLKRAIQDVSIEITTHGDTEDMTALLESQRIMLDVIPRLDSAQAGINFAEALQIAAVVSPEVDKAGMAAYGKAYNDIINAAVNVDFSEIDQAKLGDTMEIYAKILPDLSTPQIQQMQKAFSNASLVAPKLAPPAQTDMTEALNGMTASIGVSLDAGALGAAQSQINAMDLTMKTALEAPTVEQAGALFDGMTVAVKAIPEIQGYSGPGATPDLGNMFNQAIAITAEVFPKLAPIDQGALMASLAGPTGLVATIQAKLELGDVQGALGAINSYIGSLTGQTIQIPSQFLPPTGPPPAPPEGTTVEIPSEVLPPTGPPPAPPEGTAHEIQTKYGTPPAFTPPAIAAQEIPLKWGAIPAAPAVSDFPPKEIPIKWGAIPGVPPAPDPAAKEIPLTWGSVPGAPTPPAISPVPIPTTWAPVVGLPAVPAIPPAVIPVEWGQVVGMPNIPPIPTQVIPVEWGTPSGSPPGGGGGRFMGGSGSFGIGGFTGESNSGLVNSAGATGYQGLKNYLVQSVRDLEGAVTSELESLAMRATDAFGSGMQNGLRKQAPLVRQGMGEIGGAMKTGTDLVSKNGDKFVYTMEKVTNEGMASSMVTWKFTQKFAEESDKAADAIESGGASIEKASNSTKDALEKSATGIDAASSKTADAIEEGTKQFEGPINKFSKTVEGFTESDLGGGMGTWKFTQKFTEEYKKLLDAVDKGTLEIDGKAVDLHEAAKTLGMSSDDLMSQLETNGMNVKLSTGGGGAPQRANQIAGEAKSAGATVKKAGEDAAKDAEEGHKEMEDAFSDFGSGIPSPQVQVNPTVTGMEQLASIQAQIQGQIGALSGSASIQISIAPVQIPTVVAPPIVPPMPPLPPIVQDVITNVDNAVNGLRQLPKKVETQAETVTNADSAYREIMRLNNANTSSTHTVNVVTKDGAAGGGRRGGFAGSGGIAGLTGFAPGGYGAAGLSTNFTLNSNLANSILIISNAVRSAVLNAWTQLGRDVGTSFNDGLSSNFDHPVIDWLRKTLGFGGGSEGPISGAIGKISVYENGKLVAESLAMGIKDGEKTVIKAVGDLEGKVGDLVINDLPKKVNQGLENAFKLNSIGTSGLSFSFNWSSIFDVFKNQSRHMSAGYLNEYGQFVVYNINDNSRMENHFDGGLVGDPEKQAKRIIDVFNEAHMGRKFGMLVGNGIAGG